MTTKLFIGHMSTNTDCRECDIVVVVRGLTSRSPTALAGNNLG